MSDRYSYLYDNIQCVSAGAGTVLHSIQQYAYNNEIKRRLGMIAEEVKKLEEQYVTSVKENAQALIDDYINRWKDLVIQMEWLVWQSLLARAQKQGNEARDYLTSFNGTSRQNTSKARARRELWNQVAVARLPLWQYKAKTLSGLFAKHLAWIEWFSGNNFDAALNKYYNGDWTNPITLYNSGYDEVRKTFYSGREFGSWISQYIATTITRTILTRTMSYYDSDSYSFTLPITYRFTDYGSVRCNVAFDYTYGLIVSIGTPGKIADLVYDVGGPRATLVSFAASKVTYHPDNWEFSVLLTYKIPNSPGKTGEQIQWWMTNAKWKDDWDRVKDKVLTIE